MKIFFSKKCLEYSQPGHPESPLRVSAAYEYLKEREFNFIESKVCNEDDILLVHSNKLLQEVKEGDFFDADTPALKNIFYYATLAAGGAIEAALLSLKGERAFSLMRPPGHHATRNNLGGFCYFNNIAIATMKAKQIVDKIAIVDLDCHHGNGIQDIFLGRKDTIYVSLHQSPLYPGTGLKSEKNCFNYPLHAHTEPEIYLEILKEALDNVVRFNPDLIAVSMGFDTYKLDPIANLALEKQTYRDIGKMISDLGKPLFCVLEGGYNCQDLPECVEQFLTGIELQPQRTQKL
jgi:acetoin utilization deacetylase AcuC-like enzyme